MPTIRGTPGSAAPNTGAPNGALSSCGTVKSAGRVGSSVMTPVTRYGTPPPRGVVRLGTPGFLAPDDEVQYHVYANIEGSNPIDYSTPVATVTGLSWTTSALAPGTWRFGVRAFNSNGEEQNLDCSVTIVLDAEGNDITDIPASPTGLRAFATAGGGVRVEWWYPATIGSKAPTGFHIYAGNVSVPETASAYPNVAVPNRSLFNSANIVTAPAVTPNYAAPAATVLYSAGLFNTFQANLVRLMDGIEYAVGVRAYNSVGEEQNTTVVTVTADATGPAAVDSLTARAIV